MSTTPTDLRDVPMRVLNRPPPTVVVREGIDGIKYVASAYPFQSTDELILDHFQRAAMERPEVTFLAERSPDRKWCRLTYAAAWRDTAAIATWLLHRGFGPDGPPVMILSENSIEHALLMFGALRAGATVVSVSPSYSIDGHLARFEHALNMTEPGLVYAREPARYAAALERAVAPGRHVLAGSEAFAALLGQVDAPALAQRRRVIDHDTVAKILLTSGSTGAPKGVVNTHGNLIAAVQMSKQVAEPPEPGRISTVLDWLPWHHTYGGNANLNNVLRVQGTMYIDGGRPLPGKFDETIENLREISPTSFGSVPAAYAMLADVLERDAELRHRFFKNLRLLSYGGAVLPAALFERMQRLAVMELGARLPFSTGWGMTETTAIGAGVFWNVDRSGLIGLPQPGVTLKLVPFGDRYEMRIQGPHVMARYHRNDALNAAAFDEEGFFRTGDTVRWIDPQRPIEGLEFAGRLAEDFKLQSGTWVQAGIVRSELLSVLQPLVVELAVVAPDRPWLGALIWLGQAAAKEKDVRARLAERLAAFNRERRGGSTQVLRLLVLVEPPSMADGEVTDKRSVNLRRVLERRARDVAMLYADPPNARVIVPAGA